MCLKVDGAHVHNVDWILLFQWSIWNEASVHGNEIAEVRHGSYSQDDRALLEVCKIFLGKLLGQLKELFVDVRM
jgi:hypothetical protein